MELRMLEKNEGSMAEVWKTKCKELVEICNKLKVENEQMRGRLFSVSQNLQGSMGEGDQESSRMPYQDGSFLPKLMPNA
jgi:regulator of replication initiation timing